MKLAHLVFMMLLFILPMHGQKIASAVPSIPAQVGSLARYQLISVQVEFGLRAGEGLSTQLFLLDTQTGRVWRYQPSGTVGESQAAKAIPETFIPIEIWKTLPKDKTLPQE